MKSIFFPIVSILFCLSCKKETPIVTPDPCENAYDLRSKPYTYIYKGKLPDCLVSLHFDYPEQFSYLAPRVNPNNKYEICYIKKNNKTKIWDLYKYNFCTNISILLAENINSGIDWSVKGWIVFTKGDSVWKIKSNGDSLTKLVPRYFNYIRWSPSGLKCLNGLKIFDEKGITLHEYSLPPNVSHTWDTDTTFLCARSKGLGKGFEIFRYFIKSKSSQVLYSEPNYDNCIISKYSDEYIYMYIQDGNKNKYMKLNTQKWESTLISNLYFSDTEIYWMSDLLTDNLYIGSTSLKDTLTGSPCSINNREHIILLN